MRFRPANIRLINRRPNLPRLLLALSSIDDKSNDNSKNNPTDSQVLTGSLRRKSPPAAWGPKVLCGNAVVSGDLDVVTEFTKLSG